MNSESFSPNFVELRNGPTVPASDVLLLLALENRGMSFAIDKEKLIVRGLGGQKPNLTPEEVSHIKARKAHLMALVAYEAPA